jgi:pimeloyl-[acyl-carrier protein] methyl ester esterase
VSGIHVESVGAGAPLVLLHGFAMHGGLFAPILHALARRHRVDVVDLPGHGHSPPPATPLTLDATVTSVANHMATLREPSTILGWSFGGLVALRVAREFPQRVSRLVLFATTPRFVASDDWPCAMDATTLARFADELSVSYRLTLQRFLTLQVQGSDEGRATLATLRQALFARNAPSPATLTAVLRILAETDLRNDVRTVAAPALVVTGQRDALTPTAAGAWLAQAMPDARHIDIPGAAHAPFLSHRDPFMAVVDEFLDARATDLSRA